LGTPQQPTEAKGWQRMRQESGAEDAGWLMRSWALGGKEGRKDISTLSSLSPICLLSSSFLSLHSCALPPSHPVLLMLRLMEPQQTRLYLTE